MWERRVDYRHCRPDARQIAVYFACVLPLLFFTAFLFYRSVTAGLIACLAAFALLPEYYSFLAGKRRERLLSGFRDALYSISSSVSAGRQIPAALDIAARTAAETKGEESDIAFELLRISRNYELNHSDIGKQLEDFAQRSDIQEIKQFAQTLRICQLCGGDLEEVCLKSASMLLDRMSVARDVKALISQKKLDIILLAVMPAAVLIFLNLFNYGYISVLYESTIGRVVMSLCLLLMVFALLWGLRITRIEL